MIKKILKIISGLIAFIILIVNLAQLPENLIILSSPNGIGYKAGYLSGTLVLFVLCFFLFKFSFSAKK
ncbi:hypothetical protein BTO06_03975 [Tenacibaculum sp. SZ-18]|nr:hypothetical protein BTO06_03975 [Tenacibaculum sp. SZ-18]